MMNVAPSGTIGAENPSGWINENIIVENLVQSISHVKLNGNEPVLLLLDNHESLISVQFLFFPKADPRKAVVNKKKRGKNSILSYI